MGKNKHNGEYHLKDIPRDVEEFAFADFKSYYKEWKDQYSKKKEARADYYCGLLEYLPVVIDFFCTKGHVQNGDIPEAKRLCYDKFLNKDDKDRFVIYLTKAVKEEGNGVCTNIIYLPIILREMIQGIIAYNENRAEDQPPMAPADNLFNLSEAILKKRMKKFTKIGVDASLAFELLSVMPHTTAIKYSPYYRVREIFEILYKYAETMNIDFTKVVRLLFDSSDYNYIIGFALQEKKDKVKSFNEKQNALWSQITKWVFEELEDMDEKVIRDILKNYISLRKKDAANGRDGNRRFYLSSLPQDDYPRITKIINQIKNSDSEAEKYL